MLRQNSFGFWKLFVLGASVDSDESHAVGSYLLSDESQPYMLITLEKQQNQMSFNISVGTKVCVAKLNLKISPCK